MNQVKPYFAAEKPVKWLFAGDSITHGALHTFGQRDYAQLFNERVRYEMGRPQDVVLPNAFGHLAFAHLLFKELGIYDERSCTCRLFFPRFG